MLSVWGCKTAKLVRSVRASVGGASGCGASAAGFPRDPAFGEAQPDVIRSAWHHRVKRGAVANRFSDAHNGSSSSLWKRKKKKEKKEKETQGNLLHWAQLKWGEETSSLFYSISGMSGTKWIHLPASAPTEHSLEGPADTAWCGRLWRADVRCSYNLFFRAAALESCIWGMITSRYCDDAPLWRLLLMLFPLFQGSFSSNFHCPSQLRFMQVNIFFPNREEEWRANRRR